MKRREFITLLGGAAAALPVLAPLAAQAQPRDGMRRIGVLTGLSADDPEGQARRAAFLRQRDPNAPGRPRPRAPGLRSAAA